MDKALENAIAAANHYGLTDRDLAAVVEAAVVARRAEDDAPGRVAVYHSTLHRQMLVDPDAVEVYEQSGWKVKPADEPAEPPAEPDDPPAAKPKTPKTKEN
jgi:hypothetical protein